MEQASLPTFLIYMFTVGRGMLPADVAFVLLSTLSALAYPVQQLPVGVQKLTQVGIGLVPMVCKQT